MRYVQTGRRNARLPNAWLASPSATAGLALEETVEMAKAVQKANDMTTRDDTLTVVTSDHGHAMSFVGYPLRGNLILGEAVSELRKR